MLANKKPLRVRVSQHYQNESLNSYYNSSLSSSSFVVSLSSWTGALSDSFSTFSSFLSELSSFSVLCSSFSAVSSFPFVCSFFPIVSSPNDSSTTSSFSSTKKTKNNKIESFWHIIFPLIFIYLINLPT